MQYIQISDPLAATAPAQCFGIGSQAPAELRRGIVVAKRRVPFLFGLPPGCGDHCASPYKVGVRPGDWIALTGHAGGYLCADHWPKPGPSPRDGGWLRTSQVRVIPNQRKTHPARWWTGLWTGPDAWIAIKAHGDRILAVGHANWRGERFGEFKATARLAGDEADLSEGPDGCALRLLALGDRVAAEDNGQCGAPNVGFSEFYARKR